MSVGLSRSRRSRNQRIDMFPSPLTGPGTNGTRMPLPVGSCVIGSSRDAIRQLSSKAPYCIRSLLVVSLYFRSMPYSDLESLSAALFGTRNTIERVS
jgi:hypothetical protein